MEECKNIAHTDSRMSCPVCVSRADAARAREYGAELALHAPLTAAALVWGGCVLPLSAPVGEDGAALALEGESGVGFGAERIAVATSKLAAYFGEYLPMGGVPRWHGPLGATRRRSTLAVMVGAAERELRGSA